MKLFHTENNKEVVYVQMEDIAFLRNNTDIPIPASIFLRIFTDIIDDSNRFDFVRFDEKDEVQFFKEVEFIIDYNHYKDWSDEKLDQEAWDFIDKMNDIIEKLNGMTEDERSKNSDLWQEEKKLKYMLKFLSEIYDIRHKERYMPFPDFVESM